MLVNLLKALKVETDQAKLAEALKKNNDTLQALLGEVMTLRKIASPDTTQQAFALGIYGILAATDDLTIMHGTIVAALLDHILPHIADTFGHAKAEAERKELIKVLQAAQSNDYTQN